MPIKSQMSSILGQIESENPELFALEFGKIHMPMRARTSLIMGQIEPEHPELFALTLFTLQHLQILTNQHQTWSKCM